MKQSSSLTRLTAALSGALTLVMAASTLAADQSPTAPPVLKKGVIEEMIVTAEKRDTNLQKTPIAITAISGEAMNEKGLRNFNDISFAAPGLVFSQIAGMAQITIRGIGVDISTIDAEPGVALYQDGAYRGGLVSGTVLFFDPERVEIVRGPQGTLYGRNSTGGALNVITRMPRDEFSANGEILFGNYNRIMEHVGFDLPILPGVLAVRVAAEHDARDGYTRNRITKNDEDDQNVRQGKIAVHYTPTDTLDFALHYNKVHSRDGGPPFIRTNSHPDAPLFLSTENPAGVLAFPGVCDPVKSCVQVFNLTIPTGAGVQKDPRHVSYEGKQLYENDQFDANGTVTWRPTDTLNVKFIASTLDLDQASNVANNDGANIAYLVGDYVQQNTEHSYELNVGGTAFDGKLDWITGAFHYRSTIAEQYLYTLPALQRTFEAVFGIFGGGGPLPPGSLVAFGPKLDGSTSAVPFLNFRLEQKLTSDAVFAQGTYHITNNLRATFGARFTKDHKQITQFLANNLGGAGCLTGLKSDRKWDAPTGKIGVDYDLTDSVLLYASVSRGFKAGGANAGRCGNIYNPETVWAYEVGAKSQFANDTVQMNVSAFYYNYSNLQARLFINNAAVVTNASSARTYGAEVEGTWLPLEALRFDGSVSYLHSIFGPGFNAQDPLNTTAGTCPTPATCKVKVTGNDALRAPRVKFSLAAQYDIALGGAGQVSLRGEYAYTAKQFHTIFNNDFGEQKAFALGNVRAIFTPPENWVRGVTIQAFVENVADKDYAMNFAPNSTSGGTIATFGPPRTFGLRASMDFTSK